MDESSTIAAVATAPGRGGVAVVRVSGPEAFAIASALTGRRVDAACAGHFFHAVLRHEGKVLDDGLVLVFAAPASYTGEDVVEFQTHGGVVAPRRVLSACLACGARLARRGEFTQRAFLNGRLDISEAEAVIDLVDAKTDRAADDAVARLGGAEGRADAALYAAALDISSRLEHALDFSEDELPPGYVDEIEAAMADLVARVAGERKRLREGKILREGALVVLAGPPNAGKSSLLNALLGERRAIVSAEAGTTRDSIEEWLDIAGWPVRLVDTAGLRRAADAVEAEGVDRAEELIARADLVVALDLDVPGALRVHSKCDLARGEGLNVSAVTGEGLDALKVEIA
ncbi:MAG: tRNA uridine-5-carboxymethylaminomethyl(34) synthesis GTPase MnmE, partial [Kiritimatiellae bacterium]|nr:tRNA uridine-5-carboxymethylaminomethyl(34) synthesis GTPase MnmE [Kiritimatiellia bacterium]